MTSHPDATYPPPLAQGQTWEQMTVGSAVRPASSKSVHFVHSGPGRAGMKGREIQ